MTVGLKHIRSPGGRRLYDVDAFLREEVGVEFVLYARVSSSAAKDALRGQVALLQSGYPGAELVKAIGGGLTWQRKGLVALLGRLHGGEKLRIVVAHRDRLARFGFELVDWLAKQNGGEVVVLDESKCSPEPELTQDILSLLATFSCRLSGLRKYRDKIKEDKNLSDTRAQARKVQACGWLAVGGGITRPSSCTVQASKCRSMTCVVLSVR